MKKRSKKVLAFGVAALMALSSLPASILNATAAIGAGQTANGGTSYNFVLKDMATDSNTVEVSSDDVAAGNVTRTIGVYIDSEEWALRERQGCNPEGFQIRDHYHAGRRYI